MNRPRNTMLAGLAVTLAVTGAALPGCRGDRSGKRPRQFFTDMDDSPKWKPQTGSEFFADGRSMRPPPAGTVAFGPVGFVAGSPSADGLACTCGARRCRCAEKGASVSPLLAGKSAIVTGAASPQGLGMASALLLAEHGARVLITDLDAAAAEAAARALPGRGHFGARCNVTDKAECEAAAALAVTHFGRIDVLVNIAGISSPHRLMEVTPEMYSLVMDVNMRGTLYMTQAVVPTMKQQQTGSIVNMTTVSAQRGGGVYGGSHYSAPRQRSSATPRPLHANSAPTTSASMRSARASSTPTSSLA